MSKRRTVINFGAYRLAKYDRLNWELEEFRAPDETRGRNLVKDDSPKWRPSGHYFGSIGAGVSWLLEHEFLEDGGEYDLAGAIKRFGEIACDLRQYVDEAAKELS